MGTPSLELNILTQNCNILPYVPAITGNTDRKKLREVVGRIEEIDPDVVHLQEVFPSRHNGFLAKALPEYQGYALSLRAVTRNMALKAARIGMNAGGLVTFIKKDLLATLGYGFGFDNPTVSYQPFSVQWDGRRNWQQWSDAFAAKGMLVVDAGVKFANVHNAWTYFREDDPVLAAQVQEGVEFVRALDGPCTFMLGDMNHVHGGVLHSDVVAPDGMQCLVVEPFRKEVFSDFDSGKVFDWGVASTDVSLDVLSRGIIASNREGEIFHVSHGDQAPDKRDTRIDHFGFWNRSRVHL